MGSNAVPGLVNLLQVNESRYRAWMWAHASRLPARFRQDAWAKYGRPEAASLHEEAAKALGIIGPEAKAAAPFLVQALPDYRGDLRWTAAKALGRIGKGAVPDLVQALGETNSTIRHAAAYALGEMGADAEAAIPALMKSLSDPNEQVRDSATHSLSAIGGPAIIALFEARDQGDDTVRKTAAAALEKLDSTEPGTTEPLIKMAQSGETARRVRAIEALGAYRARSGLARKTMTKLLDDPVPEVRLAASKVLRQ
jgi:HEAT repeat protein